MQQLHTDNHYVPQVYLKQWATNGTLPTYNLLVHHHNVPRWKCHSLKGIAFHRHLYTQIVGGTENDDLERWLDSEFEAPAEQAIARAVTGQQLTRDDWRKLVRFAVAQDVRTPARLREFLRRQAQVMPQLFDKTIHDAVEQLKHDKLSVRPGKITNSSGFPLKLSVEDQGAGQTILRAETVVGRAMWHWSLRHLLTNTVAKVPRKGWSILIAASGYSWPTSDDPLIKLNYVDDRRYDFAGGWDAPNGDVLLPLSPTHLLHRCAGKRPLLRGHQLDPATTERVRRMIIEHADRYVFAKRAFDVEQVRGRTVNSELHKMEQERWANWHAEQIKAERG
jgi:hypothetical protein